MRLKMKIMQAEIKRENERDGRMWLWPRWSVCIAYGTRRPDQTESIYLHFGAAKSQTHCNYAFQYVKCTVYVKMSVLNMLLWQNILSTLAKLHILFKHSLEIWNIFWFIDVFPIFKFLYFIILFAYFTMVWILNSCPVLLAHCSSLLALISD